jgi:hypothetical protein
MGEAKTRQLAKVGERVTSTLGLVEPHTSPDIGRGPLGTKGRVACVRHQLASTP